MKTLEEYLRDEYRQLYGYAYRILKHEEDAEDAVMEAAARVVREKGNRPLPASYLYRAVYRTCIDQTRRRKHICSALQLEDGYAQLLPDPCAAIGVEMEARQLADTVREQVAALSDVRRQAIIDYYWGGMEMREIAEKRGLKEATVKSRVGRGREQLGRSLEGIVTGRV